MAFDQPTRARLQRFVGEAREVLREEFTRQLQYDYGMDPVSGTVAPLESLRQLNDAQRETARILRDTLAHYLASEGADEKTALGRIVREQAFTVLNRLAALRMAEARGLLIESVGNGFQAEGFQLFARLASSGLGETGDAYRVYLFSVFDGLAQDLPMLFDRFSPQGRLFPRESALLPLLALINDVQIEPLWGEDETIGWIYQYFNSQKEVQQMREAKAPRNSRELAVRNQFFTPRYVVEFLVDNTLGRLWFDATGGQTSLRSYCRSLMVRSSDRPDTAAAPRDPRTLKLLDPACGSMHFGLYAFDLLELIYQEAWEWEQEHGPGSLSVPAESPTQFEPLKRSYASREAFAKDVPRLIIEHNIFGVDIDPRAVQIASLALWLRAQRSWHEAAVKAADRPLVGQGHVVAAIAPPTERDLSALVRSQLSRLDADLFERTLGLLKGLPELGVLLRTERELPQLVRDVYGEHGPMHKDADVADWQEAEARLRAALEQFARAAITSYQGRLFAQDALQGLRLIDLARVSFDVVVMNPPFGASSIGVKGYLTAAFPDSSNDLLAVFVDRGLELLRRGGRLGAITSRTCFFLTSFADWRTKVVLDRAALEVIADLGQGVMDNAMVEAAAYILKAGAAGEDTTVIRAITAANRELAIETSLAAWRAGREDPRLFAATRKAFSLLPDSPFVYWVDAATLGKFTSQRHFEPDIGSVRQGLATGDDFRFVRAVWEVPPADTLFRHYPADGQNICRPEDPAVQAYLRRRSKGSPRWAFHVKAGASQPWYSPITLKINWAGNGAELRNFKDRDGKLRSRPQSTGFYFRPGFSWTRRAVRLYPYVIPSNCIPSVSRYMAFPEHGLQAEALGVSASRLASAFLRCYGEKFEFPNFLVENVKTLPWPVISEDARTYFEALIGKEVQRRRLAYQNFEPFHEFVLPARIHDYSEGGGALAFDPMTLLGEKGERLVASGFGLTQEETEMAERDVKEAIAFQQTGSAEKERKPEEEPEDGDQDFVLDTSPRSTEAAHFSYLLGCAFGRWDIRYATEQRQPEPLGDPFAPLPVCPPGMLQDAVGLPVGPDSTPPDYPLAIPWSGALSEDEGGGGDIVEHVRRALRVAWRGRADAVEEQMCATLGVKDLRDYLRRPSGFFNDHLSCYSKSSRKAPIYWPLSTQSGSYTLWIYYPRLTSQTLFVLVNDFLDGPRGKLTQVSGETALLRSKGPSRSKAEERRFGEAQSLEIELVELRDTLLRLAPTYRPSPDDGVQISAAPLWPLFRHKAWQKVLRETWAALEKGEYDWARLAMKYWPERVRENCKWDKSLAIAHGLEDLFVEPALKPRGTRARRKGNTGGGD